jgi:hypothetical protein
LPPIDAIVMIDPERPPSIVDLAVACTGSTVPVRLTSITRRHSSMVKAARAAPGRPDRDPWLLSLCVVLDVAAALCGVQDSRRRDKDVDTSKLLDGRLHQCLIVLGLRSIDVNEDGLGAALDNPRCRR